jgi:NAD(P)-dependent dehydrogenase (short-subunit alcohol dehydrogenase family)
MIRDSKVAVLGGTQGIGLAVAELAAREGAKVVVVSSRKESVEAALGRLPKGSIGHAVDLRSEAKVGAFFTELDPFDHLVYTAGETLMLGALADVDLVAARAFFELRYWGALAAIRAGAPHLAKTGSITLTSGTAGTRPHAGFAIGASICCAIEGAARTLALELAPVRVNVVVPGYVDTGLWSSLPADARESMFREAAAKLPVRHIGTAEEIAEHYLSFMRGTYVTGQSLVVDGGGVHV